MKKVLITILAFLIGLSIYAQPGTAVPITNAKVTGLNIHGTDDIDSAKIENDSLYFKIEGVWQSMKYTTSGVVYADDNFIFDGDAGDYRGVNTEPDYVNVSLAQTNCSDAVSTAQAHGGTRSIAITSVAGGATYYGGLDITNSSLRRETYAGLSYRFDF